MEFKRISKNTVVSQVIAQINQLIRDRVLSPGDRLPSERQMSEQLGISRPSLRESLRVLEYAGVLETRYGDGIYVANDSSIIDNSPYFSRLVNQYTLEDMVEMRKILETAAIRFAVERASDEDLVVMRHLLDESKDGIDERERFVKLDKSFHLAIADASRNNLLLNSFRNMGAMMDGFNLELQVTKAARMTICAQHERIYAAIAERDSDRAVEAMAGHLDNVVVSAKNIPDNGD